MDLKAVIEAGSESATSLIEKAAHAAEDASIRATEAVAVAREQSEQAVLSAEQAAASLRRSSKKPLIIGAAVLAAAGGAYFVWKQAPGFGPVPPDGRGRVGCTSRRPGHRVGVRARDGRHAEPGRRG